MSIKYVIGWVWLNIAFYLTVFMIIVGDGNGYMMSAIIAGLTIFIISPFTWIFIKEKVKYIEKLGRYPTLSERLKLPWSLSAYSMVGFISLMFFANLLGEEKNKFLFHSLITMGGVFFLLSIIAAIYERIRARSVNKLNN